jgi:ketosteroid isomerase-like protein
VALIIAATMSSADAIAQRGPNARPTADSGPGVSIVRAFLEAYNNRDAATIEKMVAPDIVFLDDDGHTNVGKDFVVANFLNRRMTSATPEKLTTSGVITSSGTADVIWASFPYNFERGEIRRKGLITMVFKKAGADWQIVHCQFAIDQLPANSLDRR